MEPPAPVSTSTLARLFFTRGERRLRLLWRLAGLATLLLVFGFIFALLLGGLLFLSLPPGVGLLVQQVIATLSITVPVFLARRWLDRRSVRSLGLSWDRQSARDLAVGFVLPALMMGLIFGIEWAAGWLTVTGAAPETGKLAGGLASLVFSLGLFLLVGWSEELLFRGYLLQNLADGLDLAWGIGLSSALFALLHFANPAFAASPQPFIGLFVAGLFFAYAYFRTGRLWLPIGLHFGWNFFEGPVFGFPVSGLALEPLLLQAETGPDLVTGGAFGPEAGLILLPALLLGVVLIYLYTSRSAKQL